MNFSIFMILNVSSCCSKRSRTKKRSPQSAFICDFVLSKLPPGFSRNSSDDS